MFYVGGTGRIKLVITFIDYKKMMFIFPETISQMDSLYSNSTSSRAVKSNINSQIMRLCIYFESFEDKLVS